MVKVVHFFKNLKIEKNVEEDVSFILTNKAGGYCYLASKPTSRYQGIFFNDNFKMYKTIENIKLINASHIKERENLKNKFSGVHKNKLYEQLKNNFFNIERKRGDIVEYFFMLYGFNSIVYELNKDDEIELILDIRESYSNPDFGRFYEIFEENDKIIIKYRQENEFECYLVINGYLKYEKTQKWFKQYYELDKQRNSLPYEKYVFSALKIKLKQLIFSFSFNKEKAIKENDFISKNLDKLKNKQKADTMKIINKNKHTLNKIKNKEIKFAYISTLNSLSNLVVKINNNFGIYAGLPWFFQFWTRDEAVALESLKYFEKKEIIRKILFRLIDSIKENKILNKYPYGDIYSVDAIGWILKRIHDINRSALQNNKIKNLLENLDDDLAFNNKKETWIDTIDRDNVRIEIQALKLFILKLNKRLEKKLKDKVREKFWNGKFLKDGVNDPTIRPNCFIAAYIYPGLLSKKEWIKCFEYCLPKLWLGFGLSTIDKNDYRFIDKYTGEDPKSYHNGDSWFWLNNLAALVIFDIDKKRFKRYVDKILEASTKEILWKGAIGCHAELSSAKELSSEGCFNQAWSNAMYIELVNKIY